MIVFSCATDPSEWKSYNWSEITHVIVCGANENISELYCHAHANGVRVTALGGLSSKDFPKLLDDTFRKSLIAKWMNETMLYHLDGINMDIEGAAFTKDVIDAITLLTQETYSAYKKINPNYVVTFDIPYSPYLAGCISFYCFDYVGISKNVDYMIVMDYDANIDIVVAQANSPLYVIEEGLNFYIKNLSINPDSLVMAVPWYGYDFPCKDFLNRTGNELCMIFGGSHVQRCYGEISSIISNNSLEIKFNSYSKSVYATLKEQKSYHQIWFDDSKSLSYKFGFGKVLGLKGYGMWRADCLDYKSKDPYVIKQTKQFWDDITDAMVQLKKHS